MVPLVWVVKADRWEKSAARVNAREDARFPLLAHAGLTHHVTPAERETEIADHIAAIDGQLAACARRQAARAEVFRAEVQRELGLDVVDELDAYVAARRYLHDPAYACDFWRDVLRRMLDGKAPLPTPEERLTTSHVWSPFAYTHLRALDQIIFERCGA